MSERHDPAWVRWPVALLAATAAGWLAVDGTRALTTGEYALVDGQLGPWAKLVSAIGIDPHSTGMKAFFVVYGLIWLVDVGIYLLRPGIGRRLMVIMAIGSIWTLVFGTLSSVLQLILLALGRRARARYDS